MLVFIGTTLVKNSGYLPPLFESENLFINLFYWYLMVFQADKTLLPLARLLLMTLLPPRVLIRTKKPWSFFLFRLFGWKVRFIFSPHSRLFIHFLIINSSLALVNVLREIIHNSQLKTWLRGIFILPWHLLWRVIHNSFIKRDFFIISANKFNNTVLCHPRGFVKRNLICYYCFHPT